MSNNADTSCLTDNIYHFITQQSEKMPYNKEIFLNVKQFKTKLSIFQTSSDIQTIIDISKVADIIVFVLDVQELIGDFGSAILSILLAQGLPTVMCVLTGLENIPQKNKNTIKKQAIKTFYKRVPNEPRVLEFNPKESSSVQQIIRFMCNESLTDLWRSNRSYMLVQNFEFYSDINDPQFGSLKLFGYLRGAPLHPDHLIHLTDYGDFQISKVESYNDINFRDASRGLDDHIGNLIAEPNPEEQESLQSEVQVDFLTNEQNVGLTEEEILNSQSKLVKKVVPKGTSEYQSAWIFDSDYEDDDKYSSSFDLENFGKNDEDMELSGDPDEYFEEEMDKMNEMDVDDEEESIDEEQEAKDDLEFPDEVDVPEHEPARIRYQKYRGLKSFRTSPWDPKENLPLDHGRIFQFQSFSRSKKKIFNLIPDFPVKSGQWLAITLKDVHKDLLANHNPDHPLIASALLPHENKMSVLNFTIQKHHSYEPPIKSKERLVFHTGFRRYIAFPLFSENTPNLDKHKYEKFLHSGRDSIATIYGPITYPPMPLLAFKEEEDGLKLVATGNLVDVNPDRIVLKKIILTGHPMRAKKNHIRVKGMFHNPDDVRWFKPVDLWTKRGARGQITEPVGTKGIFKCRFNHAVTNQDTVCMSLYKRVFPKWPIMPTPIRREI